MIRTLKFLQTKHFLKAFVRRETIRSRKHRNNMRKLFGLLIIATTLLIGCSDDNSSKETSILRVNLTDAPGDYEAVLIDLQGLRVNVSSDTTDGSWYDLTLDTMGQIDLLMFTNGNSIQLSEEEIEPGYLSQMRMILGDNNEIVVDGDTLDLQTPSAQQSGLKFNVKADIAEGNTFNLLIDFDAEKSIVEKGNGDYLLKPVIKVITE